MSESIWKNRIVGSGVKPAGDFKENPSNWRKHPKAQSEALQGVLSEVGWVQQVIENVRTGYVIDGHERIASARKNGNAEVPYLQVDLSPEEEKVILATLDPITGMAEADREALTRLLLELEVNNEQVRQALQEIAARQGIDLQELSPDDDPTPLLDAAEVLKEKWGVEVGQVWRLGDHLLLCGDCTKLELAKELGWSKKATLGFTSPPYWVGKEYETQQSIEEIEGFIHEVSRMLHEVVRKDESRIVINTGTGMTTSFDKHKKRHVLLLVDKWINALHGLGWNLRHIRHWIKEGQLLAISPKTDMIDQHCEFLAAFENDDGAEMQFEDVFCETDVSLIETFYHAQGKNRGAEKTQRKWALRSYWNDIRGAASSNGHTAAFPVELPFRHLLLYTKAGEIVFDPLIGSGTTLIAAERLKRICYGMELDPRWVAVTLERFFLSMGKTPERLEKASGE